MLPDVAHEPYRTHLDILNGVFGKTLRQHVCGTSPLTQNVIVWFPHVSREKQGTGFPSEFQNFLSQNDDTLFEKWPKEKLARMSTQGGRRDALVFAHFVGESGYRFLGRYHPDKVQNDGWVWRRIEKTVDSEDYVSSNATHA